MKKNIKIKIPNPFQMVNLLATGYVQLLLIIAIFEMRIQHTLYSGLMLTALGALFFLYYWVYWFNRYPKIKREWVLLLGLIIGAIAYKGGVDEGLFYMGIMLTSGLFTDNPKIFVLFEFFSAMILLASPFNYTLSPLSFYYIESSISLTLNSALYFAIFIGGIWCFTYYQRVNYKLIQAQGLKEEMAKSKERERIAQDIHDAIGHALTSLNMHLEYGQGLNATDYEASQNLMQTMKGITEDAILNLKRAVQEIKVAEKEVSLSLSQTLNQLQESLKSKDGFTLVGEVPKAIDQLPEYVQKLYFVSLREMITNTIKYSGKKTLFFTFHEVDESITLQAWDTGKGAGSFISGNGIKGISEKVKALEGDILFYDDAEKGFCMKMTLSKEFL